MNLKFINKQNFINNNKMKKNIPRKKLTMNRTNNKYLRNKYKHYNNNINNNHLFINNNNNKQNNKHKKPRKPKNRKLMNQNNYLNYFINNNQIN